MVARAVFTHILQHFLAQSVSHFGDVAISLAFISSRLEEDGLWESHSDAVFENAHIEGAPLEAVHQHEEVQTVIERLSLKLHDRVADASGWVDFTRQLLILL